MGKKDNKVKGGQGEVLAVKHLKKSGYRILEKNYATDLGEIDIIATDDKTLVFIEVKARNGDLYGFPSEAVTYVKQSKINRVAAQYIKRHMMQGVPVRFDVIEVYLYEDGRINHIINAFDSYLSF